MALDPVDLNQCSLRAVRMLRRTFPDVCPEDIRDVVSDALCLYLSSPVPRSVLESAERSTAWLRTVARRRLWRRRREEIRLRRYGLSFLSDSHYYSIPATIAEERAEMWTTDRLLQGLSPLLAETIRCHALDRHPPRVIARLLGCSVNAVKVRLKRGYRILRAGLEEREHRGAEGKEVVDSLS